MTPIQSLNKPTLVFSTVLPRGERSNTVNKIARLVALVALVALLAGSMSSASATSLTKNGLMVSPKPAKGNDPTMHSRFDFGNTVKPWESAADLGPSAAYL